MLYRFGTLYIGTVVENHREGIIYKGEVLCIERHGILIDPIQGRAYPLFEQAEGRFVELGKDYIVGIHNMFPKNSKQMLFTKKALIELANELNHMWTNITIPKEQTVRIRKMENK